MDINGMNRLAQIETKARQATRPIAEFGDVNVTEEAGWIVRFGQRFVRLMTSPGTATTATEKQPSYEVNMPCLSPECAGD